MVVQYGGDVLGRLVIVPRRAVGVRILERQVSVAIADLFAASIAAPRDDDDLADAASFANRLLLERRHDSLTDEAQLSHANSGGVPPQSGCNNSGMPLLTCAIAWSGVRMR